MWTTSQMGAFFIMNKINAIDIYKNNICHLNIGSGEELSITELAYLIKKIINYNGKLVFNSAKMDGMPRKLLDCSRLNGLGWSSQIILKNGIAQVYEEFKSSL